MTNAIKILIVAASLAASSFGAPAFAQNAKHAAPAATTAAQSSSGAVQRVYDRRDQSFYTSNQD